MWKLFEEHFSRHSAGRLVVEAFLKYGYSVHPDGTVWCGPVAMAPAKIAQALGVDRRVVLSAAKKIASHEGLLKVFAPLQPRADFSDCAKELGFDAIEISADAHASGVVSQVTGVLSQRKVALRQVIADDPDLFLDPKLTIVLDGKLDAKTLELLRKLPCAKKITIR
ncbi:MAG: hypothetical protein V1728_05675 [Candidatus Micrarchaeota archaeon]